MSYKIILDDLHEIVDRFLCFIKKAYNKLFKIQIITIKDLILIGICSLPFTIWLKINLEISVIKIFTFYLVFLVIVFLWGQSLLLLLNIKSEWKNDFTAKILIGYFSINTLPFICTMLSLNNFIQIIIFLLISFCLLIFTKKDYGNSSHKDNFITFFSLIVSIVVYTSLWSQDSFIPILHTKETFIIKPWIDSFFHSAIIREFSNYYSINILQDIMMSNSPLPLYHYASYTVPGLISYLLQIESFFVYNKMMIPFGMFLLGFASFSLLRHFFKPLPSFLGTLAIFLIPDAGQMLTIKWFSYYWLIQISPTLSYGIAFIVIAWLLMFEGIKHKRIGLIFLSYGVALLCLFFKGHIFITNSLFICLAPFIFIKEMKFKYRSLGVCFFIIIYILSVWLTQDINRIPSLIINFKSTTDYLNSVIDMIENQFLKEVVSYILPSQFLFINIIFGGLLIFVLTFGLFSASFIAILMFFRKHIDKNIVIFLCGIIFIYLLMALGLSYDNKRIGTPEELLHRPFTWAYFIISIFSTAIIFNKILLRKSLLSIKKPFKLVIILSLLMIIPFKLGKHVQHGPFWGKSLFWKQYTNDVLNITNYLKNNSSPTDIIQDSTNDPYLLYTGLSELQGYAINFYIKDPNKLSPKLSERINSLTGLKNLNSKSLIIDFMKENNIKWYILNPADKVLWPEELLNKPVYYSGNYKLFKF